MLSPELALELRAARPSASPELRARVREVAAREEPPRRRFTLPPLRRFALVAVPVAIAIAVGGALVHGLTESGAPPKRAVGAQSSGAERERPPPAVRCLAPDPGQESRSALRCDEAGDALRAARRRLRCLRPL